MADYTATVRAHYDTRRRYTRTERAEQDTIGLRRINNFAKADLLHHAVSEAKGDEDGAVSILDLCCGHGSDVHKYKHEKRINRVHFVDLSPKNIEDTMARVQEAQPCYAATYSVADVGNAFALPDQLFDVAVCHFAIHYLFDDAERRVGSLMRTLRHCMRPGAVLVVTYPDYRCVKTFANRLMRVVAPVFRPPSAAEQQPPPVRYSFTLTGAIEADEWVVWPQQMNRLVFEHACPTQTMRLTHGSILDLLVGAAAHEDSFARAQRMHVDLRVSNMPDELRQCVGFYRYAVYHLL